MSLSSTQQRSLIRVVALKKLQKSKNEILSKTRDHRQQKLLMWYPLPCNEELSLLFQASQVSDSYWPKAYSQHLSTNFSLASWPPERTTR
jgi:hypothetical protein